MVKLESLKKEYEKILNQLSEPELISNWEKLALLAKRKNYLEKIIEKKEAILELEKQIEENKAILRSREDPELVSLAETEILQLTQKKKILEEELKKFLTKEKEEEVGAVIVEIRAGTGGEEAALFARDLFRMYSKYATTKKWEMNVLNCHYSDLGGIKEIVFELKNGNVFSEMKYEGGVHRVQRIPITEKSGRIHTSTATVAVLPKPKKAEIKINPKDLKIETFKASGPGGQYVNKRMTAVRITHLPTGIVVTSQTERSLQQNKENALSILEAKLLEREERAKEERISKKRRSQIGQAKRAEKIRTYNFPQDRITDHRIKKSWSDIEKIMDGNLEPIIEALKENLS